jgi:MYXO-CTERM domain-containing protein
MRDSAFIKSAGIAIVALSIALTAKAAATIVNTGPGGNGDPGGGLTLGLNSIGGYQNLAGEFQLSAPTAVGSIFGWIGVDRDDPTGGTLNISILANDPNTGTVEFSQDTVLGPGVDQVPGWTGLTGLGLDLSAGTYWVEFSSPDSTLSGYMPYPVANPLAEYAFESQNVGNLYTLNPFDPVGVQIDGVPDATGTFGILGLGLVGVLGFAAHQRRFAN